jgi:hypothetical protein
MKRCAQCNNLYPDETQYCLNDGRLLLSERLPLPSELSVDDEEITVLRHEPIVVDLSAAAGYEPKTEVLPHPLPPPVAAIPVKRKSNVGKYLAFMIIGLLLGGGLVLATLFLTRNFNQNNDAGNNRTISNANANANQAHAAEPKNTASPANTPLPVNPEHQKRTSVGDDEFNGRVITLNAYVRSSPSRTSPELDVLPIDDRLTITARDNPNSPWFHVVCEHGASGWMHGNTIEYTR